MRRARTSSPPEKLHLAPGLDLSLDAVTKTFAILAQRRKGKTFTANVFAEELCAAGQPWVALDPTGAWWGLRSSADGKKEGLPVLVVGGQHGQLPLERTAGSLMADLVVDEPGYYVFDLSLLESKNAERQFATDFAERFYRRKARNTSPVHLFVDEADMFIPQRTPKGDERMLGAFEAIVRRGGIRGIGTTLISQRAAVVNKNVLEQLDVLIMLRTVGPNDQKAIKSYVEAFGEADEQKELMGSLASLGLGEAWVWEPGGDLFERVKIRQRRTFNSSATPKAGEVPVMPTKLADVDLDALREKIAATVEKAEAEDPKLLQKRIRELERELAARPTAAPSDPVEVMVEVEVPVLREGEAEALREAAMALATAGAQVEGLAESVGAAIADTEKLLGAGATARRARRSAPPAAAHPRRRRNPAQPSPRPAGPPAAAPGPVETEELSKQARAMLGALVSRHPLRLTRTMWATISGYSLRSSSWSQSVGQLTKEGLVVKKGDEYEPTDAGFTVFGDRPPAPASPEEIRQTWRSSLKGPQAVAFFDALVEIYPDGMSRDELSDETGYSKSSSSFSSTLSLLRRNKLVVDDGGLLFAGEELFA